VLSQQKGILASLASWRFATGLGIPFALVALALGVLRPS
jgi:hypothetical protein